MLGKNGDPIQRKQRGREKLSKPSEQLFCCMTKKWNSSYMAPNEEVLEALSRMSLGIRSISSYRDWSSKEMSDELEKYVIEKYVKLCMKSGKFLKVVVSNVPDGKSLKVIWLYQKLEKSIINNSNLILSRVCFPRWC